MSHHHLGRPGCRPDVLQCPSLHSPQPKMSFVLVGCWPPSQPMLSLCSVYYFEQISRPRARPLSAVTDPSTHHPLATHHTLPPFPRLLCLLPLLVTPPADALARPGLTAQLAPLPIHNHRGGAKRYPRPHAVDLSAHRCLARSCALW